MAEWGILAHMALRRRSAAERRFQTFAPHQIDRGGYLRNDVAVCAGAGSGLRHLVAQWHSIEDAAVAEPRQVERLVAPVQ